MRRGGLRPGCTAGSQGATFAPPYFSTSVALLTSAFEIILRATGSLPGLAVCRLPPYCRRLPCCLPSK